MLSNQTKIFRLLTALLQGLLEEEILSKLEGLSKREGQLEEEKQVSFNDDEEEKVLFHDEKEQVSFNDEEEEIIFDEEDEEVASNNLVQQYSSIKINIANKNKKGYTETSISNNLDILKNYKSFEKPMPIYPTISPDGFCVTAIGHGWIRIVSDQGNLLQWGVYYTPEYCGTLLCRALVLVC